MKRPKIRSTFICFLSFFRVCVKQWWRIRLHFIFGVYVFYWFHEMLHIFHVIVGFCLRFFTLHVLFPSYRHIYVVWQTLGNLFIFHHSHCAKKENKLSPVTFHSCSKQRENFRKIIRLAFRYLSAENWTAIHLILFLLQNQTRHRLNWWLEDSFPVFSKFCWG